MKRLSRLKQLGETWHALLVAAVAIPVSYFLLLLPLRHLTWISRESVGMSSDCSFPDHNVSERDYYVCGNVMAYLEQHLIRLLSCVFR